MLMPGASVGRFIYALFTY